MRISTSMWLYLSSHKNYNNENIYHVSFLTFDYINPGDFLEVKWLISHILMSYIDTRTSVKFNGSMDAKSLEGKEENGYSTFLGGCSSLSTFLGGWSSHSTFLGDSQIFPPF